MLDIIVDYLNMKEIPFSRLDGTMSVQARHDNIEDFNNPDTDTNIFLLSTRAGGLGLNLMTADTCIIYDSDWNPQVSLCALIDDVIYLWTLLLRQYRGGAWTPLLYLVVS